MAVDRTTVGHATPNPIAFAMVVLDATNAAMMLLLNGAAVAPPRAGVQMGAVGGVAMPPHMEAQARMQAHMQALLMSPTPILAQMVRQQLAASANLVAQGANALVDLSASDDGIPGMVPVEDESSGMGESQSIGSTAMVTAAAAALALMKLRN